MASWRCIDTHKSGSYTLGLLRLALIFLSHLRFDLSVGLFHACVCNNVLLRLMGDTYRISLNHLIYIKISALICIVDTNSRKTFT
jgi:hypothetical protein